MALKGELERQQSELQSFKHHMSDLQKPLDDLKGNQTISQAEMTRLNKELGRRIATGEKLKDAATNTVKDAAFVAPAM